MLILLTQKGEELVEKVHGPLLEHNRKLLEHMSEAEQQKLANGMVQAMDGPLSRRTDD